MKIKILILDDEKIERQKAIASLVPVGLAWDHEMRLNMAREKYDIKEVSIVGVAIHEIEKNEYLPDLIIGDIKFDKVEKSEVVQFNTKNDTSLDYDIESGKDRGLAIFNVVKKLSNKPEYVLWSYNANLNDKTLSIFHENPQGSNPVEKIQEGDNAGRLSNKLRAVLDKVILNKLNQNFSVKEKIKSWIETKDEIVPGHRERQYIKALTAPYYKYEYDHAAEKINDSLIDKPKNILARCLLLEEKEDLSTYKFTGVMKQLYEHKERILDKYCDYIKNEPLLAKELDDSARVFINGFLTNPNHFRPAGEYKDFTITKELLENNAESFTFEISDLLWNKIRNLFICQRIVCVISALEKELSLLTNGINKVRPHLRHRRLLGAVNNNDFINSVGLSRSGTQHVKYQKGYVLPDVAEFVLSIIKEHKLKNS